MIYVLLANGASVIPLFIPGILQFALLLYAVSKLYDLTRRRFFSILIVIVSLLFLFSNAVFMSIPEEGLRLIKLLLNAIVSALVAAGLDRKYKNKFPEIYSNAILLFALVGIAGLLLVSANGWHVSNNIENRQYNTNLMTTWIMDGGYNSSGTLFSPLNYRLQSMFDEPGTFGILLVPALFYFAFNQNILKASIILIAVLLTESINAIALVFFIILAYVLLSKSYKRKIISLISIAVALIFTWPFLLQLYEIKTGLDSAYESASSLSIRSAEYGYLASEWWRHLLPYQNRGALKFFENGISSSYVSWYINAGMIFIIFILSPVFVLVLKIYSAFRSQCPIRNFSIVLLAILLLSGFQRSSYLDNILFMSLTFWSMLHNPNKHHEQVYVNT